MLWALDNLTDPTLSLIEWTQTCFQPRSKWKSERWWLLFEVSEMVVRGENPWREPVARTGHVRGVSQTDCDAGEQSKEGEAD